jgi:hypothetical protein
MYNPSFNIALGLCIGLCLLADIAREGMTPADPKARRGGGPRNAAAPQRLPRGAS